ncbi:MAG: undecaprenyl/decaprenyl-phosphate alpha-N-acetylglucosaminyl 1-phosphate transferase [Phycisphaerae bacterium]|jgi:UDP-GlcNAc:undecaprenyl-phosphate GlcNAc-1-phosphate transferase|nr:undecaprenyl/decaprenyl-phosphate alpha-N-acetylglucosaminyl 1-phosphate transferase [Phycisphaerae bacterium]
MIPYVLACIALGFAIACPVTAILVRLGHRVGALDSAGSAGHVKVLRKVPNIGGVAIFWGFAAPVFFALFTISLRPDELFRLVPPAAAFEARLREALPTAWALLGGAVVLHVMGLIDDRKALGPLLKLGLQVGVAVVVATFFDVRLLAALGEWWGTPGDLASIVVTVLWIVLVTNAMNFLDNMDGLSGGLGAIAALILMTATIVNGQWFIAAQLGLLAGSLGGFLVFNRPPARIFMGDGGSLVLGFLLATLTARTTFIDTSNPEFALGSAWYGVFMPVVVLAIPLYDIISVSAIRIAQGKSPLVGDHQHFSHRLVKLGLSRSRAVGVLWMLGAVTGISGVVLGTLKPWQAALVGVQTLLVLVVIAVLERAVLKGRDAE